MTEIVPLDESPDPLRFVRQIANAPQAVNVASNFGIQLLGVITAVITARLLGPVGRGAVAVAVVWVSLFQSVLYMNIPEAVAFQTARDVDAFNRWRAAGLVNATILGVIAAAIGYFTLPRLLPSNTGAELLHASRCFLVSIPLFFVTVTWYSSYAGRHRFHRFAAMRLCHPFFYLLFIGAFFIFARVTPFNVLMANVAAHVSVLGALVADTLTSGESFSLKVDLDTLRVLFVRGASFHLTTIFIVLLPRLDQFVVSKRFGLADMGIYAVAATVAGAQGLVANGFSQIVTPIVAASPADSAAGKLVQQFRWALVCSALMGVVIVLVAPIVVPIVFGRDFAHATSVIGVLTPGYVAFGLNSVLSMGLRGLDRPFAGTVASAFAAAAFLALAPLFVSFGVTGIATAFAVANVATVVGLVIFVSTKYGIPIRAFALGAKAR